MVNKKIIFIAIALVVVLITGFLVLSTANKCGKIGQLVTRKAKGMNNMEQTYKVCVFKKGTVHETECGYDAYINKQCFPGECIKWEKCYRNATI
ncbi:MAG: hypothetical protein NTW73_00165 [Candidatus Parcubacteria bacterium]|nr:hypothetical protein [Candidatus Parcubacteria bacterium]